MRGGALTICYCPAPSIDMYWHVMSNKTLLISHKCSKSRHFTPAELCTGLDELRFLHWQGLSLVFVSSLSRCLSYSKCSNGSHVKSLLQKIRRQARRSDPPNFFFKLCLKKGMKIWWKYDAFGETAKGKALHNADSQTWASALPTTFADRWCIFSPSDVAPVCRRLSIAVALAAGCNLVLEISWESCPDKPSASPSPSKPKQAKWCKMIKLLRS